MRYHGKINVYYCDECDKAIVTIDRDEGVTPFVIDCDDPLCIGMARSLMYNVDQSLEPTYEWYKPEIDDKMPKMTRDHVVNGGLLIRKIEDDNDDNEPSPTNC